MEFWNIFIRISHVGMAQDAEKVGTYKEFKDNVLPTPKTSS